MGSNDLIHGSEQPPLSDAPSWLVSELKAFRNESGSPAYVAPKTLVISLAIAAQDLLAQVADRSDEEVLELLPSSREEIERDLANVFAYALHFADRTGISAADIVARKTREDRMQSAPEHERRAQAS